MEIALCAGGRDTCIQYISSALFSRSIGYSATILTAIRPSLTTVCLFYRTVIGTPELK